MHMAAGDAVFAARHLGAISANKRRRPDPPELSAPGAKACFSTEDLKLPEYATSAFIPRFVGPDRILKADPSTSTYLLELPPHLSRLHKSFHVSRLRPHRPNDDTLFPGRSFPDPPPVSVHDDAQWEVQALLLDRTREGVHEFLVSWAGYCPEDYTWEPEDSLREHASETVDAYIASKGGRLRKGAKGSGRSRS